MAEKPAEVKAGYFTLTQCHNSMHVEIAEWSDNRAFLVSYTSYFSMFFFIYLFPSALNNKYCLQHMQETNEKEEK